MNAIAVLCLCVLVVPLTWSARPFGGVCIVAGLIVGYSTIAVALFAWRGLWLDIVPAVLAVLLSAGLAAADRMSVVRRLFGRYVSRVVVDELLSDSSQHSLGATGRREVTVLFSDINGFSTICEKRTAEEVMEMLNIYFETMIAIVEDRGGWLKQFVGDEIMAIYGVPRPLSAPERAAVESALAMTKALRRAREADPSGSRGFYAIKMIWPARGRISSPFGYRANPFTGVRTFHAGMDIVVNTGTSVKTIMDGSVSDTGYNGVFGNYIIVTHGEGYQTLYGHLSAIGVRKGQNVSQGSVIGRSGNSGYSTGPHLHLSVLKWGRSVNPQIVMH